MTLVARLREQRYRAEIRESQALYRHDLDASRRASIQLDLLNETWERNLRYVPRWRALSRSGSIPARFASLEEFASVVEPMTRETLQTELQASTSSERAPDLTKMTGGSTAKPVHIPFWSSELAAGRPHAWVGRGWYGVRPSSRLFHLWGHSHLLGTGVSGWLNARKRELYDRLLGYSRQSAYDLRPEAMRAAARRLVAFRPEYVVGYSVALDLLAKECEDLRDELRGLGLKVVIGTAEGFPSEASVPRIGQTFACPVAMEYGAVETGIMAHTDPTGGYRVFWRSFLLEAEASPEGPRRLRVTSLYPRSMPLVRYEIGDEILYEDGRDRVVIGLDRFDRVAGRCNDYVELPNGKLIHSEAFSHVVRPASSIRGYQVYQDPKRLCLRYTARAPLTDAERSGIRERLERIEPSLRDIELEEVDSLEQTVAGKTRMVLKCGM
jgi:phenylacetate-CoA ligase